MTAYSAMSLKEAREVLGVSSLCTRAEIRRAFREAAKLAHPDVAGGDDSRFRQVVEAFRRLEAPFDERFNQPPATTEQTRPQTLTIGPLTALNGGPAEHRFPDGRLIRITLPPGLRSGDTVRAGGVELTIYMRTEAGVLVRGDDIWVSVTVARHTLAKGGRLAIETPIGRRIVWITKEVGERGLVRLVGQGLPARGPHRQGHLFLRLAPTTGHVDSAARSLLRRFAAAWAA